MGITFDVFRQEGNTPSVRQALHNSASTGEMTTAADLNYFTSTPSWPQLLLGLSRSMMLYTFIEVTWLKTLPRKHALLNTY